MVVVVGEVVVVVDVVVTLVLVVVTASATGSGATVAGGTEGGAVVTVGAGLTMRGEMCAVVTVVATTSGTRASPGWICSSKVWDSGAGVVPPGPRS